MESTFNLPRHDFSFRAVGKEFSGGVILIHLRKAHALLRFTLINLEFRCEAVALVTRNSRFSSEEKRCYVLPIIPATYLSSMLSCEDPLLKQ
ncbi:hypothetical protein TNIN_375941 [Trichonephila inaurata madagascariensis]|uniref:Uncharacterized protein n=1 Tax=Trichonephila inaurata madagascariensis TaxID=2747483 RepID=A0A8X6JUF8_9ARAC|nr:hypothetical protein TNIN_375941 [Trichonephila inaurata madagascariensis]